MMVLRILLPRSIVTANQIARNLYGVLGACTRLLQQGSFCSLGTTHKPTHIHSHTAFSRCNHVTSGFSAPTMAETGDAGKQSGSEMQDSSPTNHDNPITEPAIAQMSKRAQKRLLRKEKLKEMKKAKRAAHFTKNPNPGFSSEIFSETDYYFENGLRKVYPYPYTFSTYAKERWYGRTIQDVFEVEFRVDSPDNIKTSIAKGNLRVNGQITSNDYILKNGDLIEHLIHRHENPVSGEPIEIIEDTPDVVVINKPSSIPCHPCGKFRFNSIVFIMGKDLGYANLRNIYRLDRLTSGVLIMGKTARKTKELETQVLKRQVQKEYVARVIGEFPEGEVEVNEPLDCLSHKLSLWQVRRGGKPSRTTFQRISYNGKTSLVRCFPHTGRTHQIRVHLQYLGHPIVNDPFYNSTAWGPLRGKGGHCDVSWDELSQRIMKEHNVGMWHDGENPLFGDRLAAESDSQTFRDSTTTNAKDENAEPELHETCVQDSSPAGSPEPKKRKLSSPLDLEHSNSSAAQVTKGSDEGDGGVSLRVHNTREEDAEVECDQEKNGRPGVISVADGGSTLPEVTKDTGESAKETEKDTLCMKETVSDGKPPSIEKLDSTSLENLNETPSQERVEMHEASSSEKKVGTAPTAERKGFEPERWVPDPSCKSCRLKYIDPKPTDLLLYLHAYRYKGPTWDYTAKMPAWAAEDWEEPEEYNHFLH